MTTETSELPVHDLLAAFLVQLADQGYADQVGSWISDSVPNIPITGEQLLAALPESALTESAQDEGVSELEYAEQLAQILPGLADSATPQGELPEEDEFEQYMNEFFDGLEDTPEN
ncbi:YidB family protein [Streptomyces scopuliridis]|uniref:YidB family protein n=1 Tax=Streptomyces scopuliridis TaxID=452529 RepID=UPI00343FD21E